MTTGGRTLIVGAGGHGQVVAEILLHAAPARGQGPRRAGDLAFVDDTPGFVGRTVFGLPVVGGLDDLPGLEHDAIIVAIGDNRARAGVLARLRGAHVISAVHESAVVADSVTIGPGVVIAPGVVVNPLTRLGEGVILNTGCTVDHHNDIGPCAHVAPGAHLAGSVVVGEGALVGVGASLVPGVHVGAWAVVGAGAAVVDDVAAGVTAVGVPARPMQRAGGR